MKWVSVLLIISLIGCLNESQLDCARAKYICNNHSGLYSFSNFMGETSILCNDGSSLFITTQEFRRTVSPEIAEFLKEGK